MNGGEKETEFQFDQNQNAKAELAKLRIQFGAGKKLKRQSLRLTKRDFEILSFLLDQKFATLEQIYFRFFDVRVSVSDPLPNKLFVTRQRLQALRQHNFIKTERVYSEAKSVYLISKFGFDVLKSRFPNHAYKEPLARIDFRQFEHDLKVTDCRIAIERSLNVLAWIPERRLRHEGFKSESSTQTLPKEIVPDAVFVTAQGKRIAFEIETSIRKKARYERKLSSFESVMWGEKPLIHHLIWAGSTERIVRDLKKVIGRHQEEKVSIETYEHFKSKLSQV